MTSYVFSINYIHIIKRHMKKSKDESASRFYDRPVKGWLWPLIKAVIVDEDFDSVEDSHRGRKKYLKFKKTFPETIGCIVDEGVNIDTSTMTVIYDPKKKRVVTAYPDDE